MGVDELRTALEGMVEGQWSETLEDVKQALLTLPRVWRHLLLLRASGWHAAELERAYKLRDVYRTLRRAEATLLKLLNQ